MKLFKIIMNCVIAALLVVSVTINIFAFAGFKLVKTDSKEPDKNPCYRDDYVYYEEYDDTTNNSYVDNQPAITVDNETEKDSEDIEKVLVYEDRNIKVNYCGLKEDCYELTYLFEIENKSTKTLNVTFDDLYINNERVYVSGLTCENLLPGTSEVEDFVVKDVEFDYDNNKNSEMKFTFNIKLMNAKSYLDLYKTGSITLTIA